MLTNLSTYT